jgi:hypothetical protein
MGGRVLMAGRPAYERESYLEDILRLQRRGMTADAIARALNISRATLYRILAAARTRTCARARRRLDPGRPGPGSPSEPVTTPCLPGGRTRTTVAATGPPRAASTPYKGAGWLAARIRTRPTPREAEVRPGKNRETQGGPAGMVKAD